MCLHYSYDFAMWKHTVNGLRGEEWECTPHEVARAGLEGTEERNVRPTDDWQYERPILYKLWQFAIPEVWKVDLNGNP